MYTYSWCVNEQGALHSSLNNRTTYNPGPSITEGLHSVSAELIWRHLWSACCSPVVRGGPLEWSEWVYCSLAWCTPVHNTKSVGSEVRTICLLISSITEVIIQSVLNWIGSTCRLACHASICMCIVYGAPLEWSELGYCSLAWCTPTQYWICDPNNDCYNRSVMVLSHQDTVERIMRCMAQGIQLMQAFLYSIISYGRQKLHLKCHWKLNSMNGSMETSCGAPCTHSY